MLCAMSMSSAATFGTSWAGKRAAGALRLIAAGSRVPFAADVGQLFTVAVDGGDRVGSASRHPRPAIAEPLFAPPGAFSNVNTRSNASLFSFRSWNARILSAA